MLERYNSLVRNIFPTQANTGRALAFQVEGLVTVTGRAGSSPVSGIKQHKGLRRFGVSPFLFSGSLICNILVTELAYVEEALLHGLSLS